VLRINLVDVTHFAALQQLKLGERCFLHGPSAGQAHVLESNENS
jgi:hypothetical protein